MPQEKHTINYYGLEFNIIGNYDKPEEETNYKGGWVTEFIKVNDVDVYEFLNESTIKNLANIVLNENY